MTEKIIKNMKLILAAVSVMTFAVAVFSTLTYGQANIHSDTAMASFLVRSQLKHFSLIPKTWNYANGDIIFLDNNLTILPFEIMMKNMPLARMLGSAFIMILAAVSLIIFDKKMIRSGFSFISIPVIFTFLFGGNYYLMWGNDFMNYQACITIWLIMIPVMTGLACHLFINRNRSIPLYVFFFLLSVLLYARGLRAIAEVFLPLLGALIIFLYFEKKADKGIMLFIVPSLIGCICFKILSSTRTVHFSEVGGTKFVGGLDAVFANFLKVFQNIFDIFGFNRDVELTSVKGLANIAAFFMCLAFCFVIPVFQYAAYKKETKEVRFFLIFVLLHNLEMVTSTVFFDKTFPSHIFTFVLMQILVSSHYILGHIFEKDRFLTTAAFAALCLIMSLQLLLAGRGWQGRLSEKRQLTQILVEHGLDKCKGYGGFWDIYPLGIYSDMKLDVAAIGNSDIGVSLTPYRWLVDSDEYIPQDCGSYLFFNWNVNEELGGEVEKIYGECTEKFSIGENFVYVWDYDICVNEFGGRK